MERTKIINILAALSLTGIVLLTFVGFSLSDGLFTNAQPAPVPEEAVLQNITDVATNANAPSMASNPQLEALQTRNAEMESLLQEMAQRESEYQNRLREANQAILNVNPPAPDLNVTTADPQQNSQLQAYQAQNEQLKQALEVMQAREAEYQAQIEAANALLQQQQAAPAAQAITVAQPASATGQGHYEDDDDDDHDDYDDDDYDDDHDDDHDDEEDDD